jgi:lysophospholipase L1-like esterase
MTPLGLRRRISPSSLRGIVGRRGHIVLAMLGLLASATVGLTSLAGSATPAAATTTPDQYDVAMGDSLAAGTGASATADDYVSLLYQHELARHAGLQLENLGCGGATTASVVNGPGCSYATGTQLGDAEAFLRSHPGQVEMLTIDIGANDVDGCIGSSGINTSCLQSGLSQISTDLPVILRGLRAADPTLAIYGMDYYDPFLSEWLTGASGQTLAQESETGAVALNNELGQIYGANKAAMADPATLFQTSNFALTGTYNGTTVPENVALICAWTLMCSENNIHANDEGHAELALAFESVIDQPPTTSVLIPAGGATVSGIALLDATASDVGFIADVQFALTGGSLNQTVVGTATPTIYGYLFELNTTTVPNGTYTLQSIASDTAGNSASSTGIPITVDNPPPTTSMVIPASGGTTVSGTTILDATAADAGGVAKVQFALTGGTFNQAVLGTATPTIYGYVFVLDTTTVSNGSYTLQSVASNAVGTTGYSPGVQITIAN